MSKNIDGRLAYADLLRSFSILGVVVLHISTRFLNEAAVSSPAWEAANLYDGLTRWCVPVFLMLSGMFLLEPKKGLSLPALFFHNILRIAVALAVWGTAYALVDVGLSNGGLSWDGVLTALGQVLRGNTHYHLWFLYMIIGLYLVTPLLRAFVRGASRGDMHYAMFITFLLIILLPNLLLFFPSATLSLYLAKMEIYLLMGFSCYFVAGYYLKNYTIGRLAEVLIYIFGVVGAVVTVLGTSLLSHRAGGTYTVLYGYMMPNVALMAVAVFVLFRYVLGVSEERGRRKRLGTVARVSFGIYLVHDFFIMLLGYLGAFALPIPTVLAIPLWSVVVFLPSYGVAWLLSKIPFIGRYLT